ncbi:hypothetical protein M885DRAFT_518580 [Pelagophyceae sp. CCMP2097]|nr:hypothetical protein M885DRAFT_518580 [Pelagophyceae sp. CCMP2097]
MACLYGLLKVDRTASADALRRAFYALAKKTHPDKRPGDAEAAEHFRTLKKAYDVLRDPARRARYDKTGHSGDEELFGTAAQYYDKVDISTEDIDQFTSEYLGSEAEVADVLAYVRQNLGDVSRILESIIGSGDGDAARLAAVARAAFDAEELDASLRVAFDESAGRILTTASLEDEGVDLNSEDGDDEEDDDEEGDDEEGDEEDDDEEEEGDCDDGEDAANDVAEDEKPTPSKRAKAAPVDADAGLLAMFAARQGAREAGFSAFESKWAAKASKASLPKAPKAAAQPKAQKPPQPPKAKARR